MSVNNSSFQRNCNISLIANTIKMSKGISRINISEELSLYKSSVTNIVSILLENKIIEESDEITTSKRIGPKAKLLKLNPKVGNIVGIEINHNFYKIVFVNFAGDTIYQDDGVVPKNESLPDIIDYAMKKVLTIKDLLPTPILAINFGIAGIIDSRNGVIEYLGELDIHNFDIYEYGKQKYGIPFYCDNDANCCSWFELMEKQNSKSDDFLTVYAVTKLNSSAKIKNSYTGIGLGMSLVINNSVYTGKNFKAGEYLSYSWDGDNSKQSGIDENTLKSVNQNEKSFRLWLKDLCTSLLTIISILDISTLFLLGDTFNDKQTIMQFIQEDSPSFLAILKKEKINIEFEKNSNFIVAKGAALMFLQKLFNVPSLFEVKDKTYLEWDNIFDIIKNGER